MTPKEVLKDLRIVQEKYANKVTPTFDICISDMARDAADAIDSLQSFVDYIGTLTTCNDCGRKFCPYGPSWGKSVRYNCPLYLEGDYNYDT
jgi:hypothetical protein